MGMDMEANLESQTASVSAQSLADFKFTDIYLGNEDIFFSGVVGEKDPLIAPENLRGELLELRSACFTFASDTRKEEFPVFFNGVSYRASTLKSKNETVYVIRRIPDVVPSIFDTGIHPSIINMMMDKGMTGLVVICGSYGQGKTTTASALVSGRLSKLGGIAVTIEDPPEMPLEGRYGDGKCYQTWVEQGGFGQGCRKAARWAPSIIFMGEIRDGEAAKEAVQASVNGCLVICTVHAETIPLAVERIMSLASSCFANSDDVANLIAGALTFVLHQRLEGVPKRPKVQFMNVQGEYAPSIRTNIKNKRFELLSNAIDSQTHSLFKSTNFGNKG